MWWTTEGRTCASLVSRSLSKNFDIDIQEGDGSVILQIIHIALLVEYGSDGGTLTGGELGLLDRIDVSKLPRVDKVPETLIEFSRDAVNAGTPLILELVDSSLQLLLREGRIKHAVVVRGDALFHCAKEFLLGTKVDRGRIKVSSDPKEVGPVRVDGPVRR